MEQLYRSVKCSERLPDKPGQYHTNMGLIHYLDPKHENHRQSNWSWEYDGAGFYIDQKDIGYWLEPLKHPPSTPQVPSKSAKEFLESVQAEHFYEHGVYFDTFSKIAEVMEQYAQSKISEAEIADILFQTEESMVKEDEDVTIMEVINAQSKAIISKLER